MAGTLDSRVRQRNSEVFIGTKSRLQPADKRFLEPSSRAAENGARTWEARSTGRRAAVEPWAARPGTGPARRARRAAQTALRAWPARGAAPASASLARPARRADRRPETGTRPGQASPPRPAGPGRPVADRLPEAPDQGRSGKRRANHTPGRRRPLADRRHDVNRNRPNCPQKDTKRCELTPARLTFLHSDSCPQDAPGVPFGPG
jgi:hypothetical protein